MNLIFHIFRKDVRRLWIEILVSFAALVVYLGKQWQAFTPDPSSSGKGLALLVLLSWAFLIVRLIQAEPLLGQRLFWITRPYTWWQLLSAKLLFIVLCIAAPLAISQIVLLFLARVPVAPALAHISFVVLATVCVVFLPCIITAAATRTLTQWILLATLLSILSVATFAELEHLQRPAMATAAVETMAEDAQLVVFGGLVALGIVIQYWRRNQAWLGPFALAAAVGFAWLVPFSLPVSRIFNRAYPALPLNAGRVFVPAAQPQPPVRELDANVSDVDLAFHLRDATQSPEVVLNVDARMISLRLPDGAHWESGWQGLNADLEASEQKSVEVKVPRAFYDRAKAVPVSVQVSLAVSEFHAPKPRFVHVEKQFYLPGVGFCWNDTWSKSGVSVCRTSVSAAPILVSIPRGECHLQSSPRRISRSWGGGPFWGPLSLSVLGQPCASKTLVISTLELVRRYQVNLKLGSLQLGDYRAPDNGISFDLRNMWE